MIRAKILLPALLLVGSMSSCLTKGRVIRANEYSGEDFININLDEKAKPVTQTVQNLPTTPTRPAATNVNPRPADRNRAVSPLSGEWTIIEAGGFQIYKDQEMPYLIFSDKDGKFYASNGCNVLNGKFSATDRNITFSNVLTTMMLCSDIGYENEISAVLSDGTTVKYKIEKENTESYLSLYTLSGDLLMRLRRHNLEIINGQWEVEEIEGEEVEGSEVNVFFDVPELTIHGNTGCNFFNGIIVIDPTVTSAISFAQMGVTQRACPNHDIERSMLVALEQTFSYELHHNMLLLKDFNGHVLMKLIRHQ